MTKKWYQFPQREYKSYDDKKNDINSPRGNTNYMMTKNDIIPLEGIQIIRWYKNDKNSLGRNANLTVSKWYEFPSKGI